MIDPVIEALTTPVKPLFNATSAMINSAAFPKVALRKPPTPAPERDASCSVARPIQPARGTIAIASDDKKHSIVSPRWNAADRERHGDGDKKKSSGVNDQPDLSGRHPHRSVTTAPFDFGSQRAL